MDTIRIDVGVYTTFYINLSQIDFSGIKEVIFTVKNNASVKSDAIIERTFTNADNHEVTVTPEESVKLINGAVYDLNKITLDGKRKKITGNGKIELRNSVGDCLD